MSKKYGLKWWLFNNRKTEALTVIDVNTGKFTGVYLEKKYV
ncbi:MAG: hypothetical protein ACLTT7_03975 [Paraclostridium bifermentans]